jgi:Bacterial protein of unknown function (DUF937)
MNLVKLIQEQLSGNTTSELSSAIGEESEATGAAVTAAVPTLLAGLAKLFSSPEGASRLGNVLSSPEIGAMGNVTNPFGGDSGSLMSKGAGLLGSLFGDGITNAATGAISRFSGLSPSATRSLLAMLMPFVLGKVANQWRSQGGTSSALSNLFNEQKRNITDAMPAGFSLDGIPGLGDATKAAQSAANTARRTAETAGRAAPSMASWLVPLAIAAVVGFLLWNVLKPKPGQPVETAETTPATGEEVVAMKPAIPETTALPTPQELATELDKTFTSIGDTFGGIRDQASAEAATAKLTDLEAKIDRVGGFLARLPEATRAGMQSALDSRISSIKEQAQKTLDIPGLSAQVKALINRIITKLEAWTNVERAS